MLYSGAQMLRNTLRVVIILLGITGVLVASGCRPSQLSDSNSENSSTDCIATSRAMPQEFWERCDPDDVVYVMATPDDDSNADNSIEQDYPLLQASLQRLEDANNMGRIGYTSLASVEGRYWSALYDKYLLQPRDSTCEVWLETLGWLDRASSELDDGNLMGFQHYRGVAMRSIDDIAATGCF